MPETTTEPTALADLAARWERQSVEYLSDWQDYDSHDGQERRGQGIALGDAASELRAALAAAPATSAGALEVGRLRAELAETRVALATVTAAWRDLDEGGREIVEDDVQPLAAALDHAQAWRSVRGDAPAPAASEQPAVVTQNAGEARRQALGIDGTMGDAQDVPHPYVDEGGTWASCLVCGLARGAVVHAAERRGDPPAEPPAVELPVTLSSVDDVAAVCLAHGLTVRSSGPGWTQWRDPDTKAVVHCEAWQSGVERVTVAGRDRADIYRPVARGTLVAAIEAAWGGSR